MTIEGVGTVNPHSLKQLFEQPCILCGRHYDEEVRGWPAAGQTGKDLDKRWSRTEPGDYGELCDSVYWRLAKTPIQAHEAAASGTIRDPC